MARIASIGSALQDLYLIDHDDLAPTKIGNEAIFGKVLVGAKVDIDKISYSVGGGGVNSAIEFSRHGHETIFIGNIARDTAGDSIVCALDRESIDTSYINLSNKKATGTSVILLDSKSGERTVLSCRGASSDFSNLDENDLDLIQPDWIYVTSLRGDMDTLLRFFEKAKSIGTKIMFNPGVKELEETKKLIGLLEDVDILLLNKSEASKIVPGTTLSELLYHLGNYVETVIITSGSMGGIATNQKETYRFGIYEDLPIKDTTGAGDAFGSGFLAHLASGKSFKSSLIFASANSTSIVAKIGANKNLLTGSEPLHPMPIQKI